MVFAPSNNPNDTSAEILANQPFFPNVEVAKFRTATRVVDTVTDGRVAWALRKAMLDTNKDLRAWRVTQETAGYDQLSKVPAETAGSVTALEHYYLTAVYARAQAQLIDYYNDTSATEEGMKRFIGFQDSAESYRREAHEALRSIKGESTITVELI